MTESGKNTIPFWKLKLLWVNRSNLVIEGMWHALIAGTIVMAFLPAFVDVGASWPMGLIKAMAITAGVLIICVVLFVRFRIGAR